MSRDVKPFRNESSALVSASPEQVFAYLDDHKRLASHMSQPSWRMGWSSMQTNFDAFAGQEIGSHIRMSGRILGLKLSLDEVVTEREPPGRKIWETWVQASELLRSGKVDLRPLASHVLPLRDALRGFELILAGQAVKPILVPD